jgi:PAS domain S-box-containing protein
MADWAKFWNPLLDKIWNNLEIGICLVGEDNKFLKVNPFMCRMLGYTETELQDLEWSYVTLPSDVKDDLKVINDVLNGKKNSYSMMKFYQPKIGPPIATRLTVVSMRDNEERFAYFISQIVPLPSAHIPLSEHDQATLLVAKWITVHWKKILYTVILISALLAGSKITEILKLVKGL